MSTSTQLASFALVGPGGEPVDLWRTMQSHGLAELPPAHVDAESRSMELVVRLADGSPTIVTIAQGGPETAAVTLDSSLGVDQVEQAVAEVRHILRMDADLSEFYRRIAGDPELSWAASGAGRLTRSATVFEDVIKIILTTNCAWSGTVRMVSALVEHLGDPGPGAPDSGPAGRAFPTPEAMLSADESFYREVVKAGYRAPHLREIARRTAYGEIDVDSLESGLGMVLPDEDIRDLLLMLPGVGPYAAAHIMMVLGRFRPLILDSWTRPTYARLTGRESVTDQEIIDRFAKYEEFAGLAFWLFVTRDWVEDG